MRKHSLTFIFIATLSILLLTYFYFNVFSSKGFDTNIAYTEYELIDIFSEDYSFAESVLKKVGEEVQKGEVIAIINSEDLELEIIELDSARSILEKDIEIEESKIEKYETTLFQVNQRIKEGEISRDILLTIESENEKSFRNGIIDKMKLLSSQLERSKHEVALSEMYGDKSSTIFQIEESKIKIEATKVKIAELKKRIEQKKKEKDKRIIKSPFEGRIAKLNISENGGTYPNRKIVSLIKKDSMFVVAYYDENSLPRISLNSPVKIKIDALPDNYLDGHIESIGVLGGASGSTVSANYSTGYIARLSQRVPVIIAIDSPMPKYLPMGLSVVIENQL